jgi:hypothetical protein
LGKLYAGAEVVAVVTVRTAFVAPIIVVSAVVTAAVVRVLISMPFPVTA